MKKLILFFLILLGLASCGTRHKTKITDQNTRKIEAEKQHQVGVENLQNSSEKKEVFTSDNATSQFVLQQNTESLLQSFTLKSNGNCIENSAVRFVSITDAKGNKTDIPVNDNTELTFSHQNDIKTENLALQTENNRLKKELSEKETSNKTLKNELHSERQKVKQIQRKLDLEVQYNKPSFWLFILVGVIAIIAWELIKINLKKLYNYVSIWKKKP